MLVIEGKSVVDVDTAAFDARSAGYARVVVDVGTGDGRFPLHMARRHPDALFVGVDSLKENLEEVSRKAARPPRKGGVANVVYVWASAEDPPPELRHRADEVQVILPWGRLMVGVLTASPDVLDGLRALGREGTTFRAVINAEVWGDPIPVEARDLPELTVERAWSVLAPAYERHGIRITDVHVLTAEEVAVVRSTWAKRLASSRRAHPRFVGIEGRYL